MARRAGRRPRRRRPRPCAFSDRAADRPGAPLGRLPAVLGQHGLHQHDSGRQASPDARRPESRKQDPLVCALERHGDGRAREQAHECGRPHRELRLGGDALRRGLQSLLARRHRKPGRRPRIHPGSFGDRRLLAGVPARPPDRGTDGRLSSGSRRAGDLVVSASVADAGVLAVSDGIDGPRTADGDLPGALHEVSAEPRAREHRGSSRLVLLRRRRDGRARIDGRDQHGIARDARQPDLRRQLQPATARRAGARQRQDHSGTRERFPRCGLERDQGDLGHALGRAVRARQEGHASTANTRRSSPRTARTCASTSSTHRS